MLSNNKEVSLVIIFYPKEQTLHMRGINLKMPFHRISVKGCCCKDIGIPIIKLRQSYKCLIFMMIIPSSTKMMRLLQQNSGLVWMIMSWLPTMALLSHYVPLKVISANCLPPFCGRGSVATCAASLHLVQMFGLWVHSGFHTNSRMTGQNDGTFIWHHVPCL